MQNKDCGAHMKLYLQPIAQAVTVINPLCYVPLWLHVKYLISHPYYSTCEAHQVICHLSTARVGVPSDSESYVTWAWQLTFEMLESSECIPRRSPEEVTHHNVKWEKENKKPVGNQWEEHKQFKSVNFLHNHLRKGLVRVEDTEKCPCWLINKLYHTTTQHCTPQFPCSECLISLLRLSFPLVLLK